MTPEQRLATTFGQTRPSGHRAKQIVSRALFLAAFMMFPHLAPASIYSFTGTFATDDQVQLFNLMLTSDSTVTFQSLGYGGGTNAAGTVIPPGGLDSFFTWFDATGNQIGTNDDGCGNAKSNNGACLDAYVQAFLPAGSYVLALTESGNEPNGSLSDGFSEQDAGNFTCPQGFCDSFGNQDNGSWAVDIGGVDSVSAVTPEPRYFALTLFGLSLFVLARRRRNHSRTR